MSSNFSSPSPLTIAIHLAPSIGGRFPNARCRRKNHANPAPPVRPPHPSDAPSHSDELTLFCDHGDLGHQDHVPARASAPLPKFVIHCRTLSHELRKQRGTSGVDLTFATYLAARSRSECQIQNSTRN